MSEPSKVSSIRVIGAKFQSMQVFYGGMRRAMLRAMPRIGRRVFFGGLVALTSASGCLSPTLPLPPPERPEVDGPDPETGEVRLRGVVPPRAQVHAINLSTFEIRGQIVGGDGRYDFLLPAQVGDELAMYYRQGTTESMSINFIIRDPDAQ